MELSDLLRQGAVLPETVTILDKVTRLTGKGFTLQTSPHLPVPAQVKIARSHMPSHIILVRKPDDLFLSHYIAHECGHILRYYAAIPENRKIVRSHDQMIQKAISDLEQENMDVVQKIPVTRRYQSIRIWIDCLISQVTSLPMDIFIEKWLYDEYPGLRGNQEVSLKATHDPAVVSLNYQNLPHIPPSVLLKSNAMNYSFYKIIDRFLGTSFFSVFDGSECADLGEKLFGCIGKEDGGLVGDIVLVDRWAEILGVREWFTWGGFEDVPEGYGRE
jgi:hypothetical protein